MRHRYMNAMTGRVPRASFFTDLGLTALLAAALLAGLLLSGCPASLDPRGGERGLVRITIAGGAAPRTVQPVTTGLAYRLTFASGHAPVDIPTGANSAEVYLEDGTYIITATASNDAGPVASGSITITLAGGVVTTNSGVVPPIILGPEGAEPGTLRYSIASAEAVSGTMSLSGTDGTAVNEFGTNGVLNITADLPSLDADTSLPAGRYILEIRLSDQNNNIALYRDVIEIWPGTDTVISFAPAAYFDPALIPASDPLTDAGDVAGYLNAATGGATADDPVFLPVAIDLTGSDWGVLLDAIDGSPKYVALDLSAATGIVEFDPGTANTGKSKIAALILPVGATGIKAGSYTDPTFKDFTALKSVGSSGITTIGGYAFSNCDALEAVSFPEATDIGDGAFYGCDALTTVDFPKAETIGSRAFYDCALTTADFPAATDIGMYAFFRCDALETVDFPMATDIGNSAFYGCTALTTASFPAAATIGEGAFNGCKSLETADFPMATDIGNRAFYGCTALTTADFPAAATIGEGAFNGCKSLETAYFPAVTTISGGFMHNGAFVGCESLKTADFPKAITIGAGAFSGCDALTTASFPAATAIDARAFEGCNALTMVSFPEATTIDARAFEGCNALTTASFPAATTIGEYTFRNCAALTTVSLPATLTTIGVNPFLGCVNLTTIEVDEANPAFMSRDGMLLNKAGTTLIAYPSASGEVTVDSSITSIGDAVFEECATLTSASFPAVTSIGVYAFYGCTALTTANIPEAISISYAAFYGCAALETASFPKTETIDVYAFNRCATLKTASFPKVKTIGDGAFFYCAALTTVNIPEAETIGDAAFYNCVALETLTLPATPPSLGSNVFENTGNSGILTIKVPAKSAYTSAWGVNADTAAGGNTSKYGSNHKRILISE